MSSNADKQKHGQSAMEGLESILKQCQTAGYIKAIKKNFRIGKEGYSSNVQFYAPFVIEFMDNAKWAIFSTTTMRTDRIKGNQWDAINLKQIDTSIERVYLIYPDGAKEEKDFIRQNNKFINLEEYSAIDEIISQNTIFNYIENRAVKEKTSGQIKDIQGNNFERRIATLLSYANNLKKMQTNDNNIEGMHFDTYKDIINCFELDSQKIENIKATCDKKIIGKLPSGGNPKTDVLVEVTNKDGTTMDYTISCKRSSEKSVTVHQYTADTFAEVLNPSDQELKTLLNGFQTAGSLSAFGEDNCNKLTTALAPYLTKLSTWVFSGVGGIGSTPKQCANYMIIYDNNDDSTVIHRMSDYISKIMANKKSGHFGTPFTWTYPSKQRGEYIQLKYKMPKDI
jgi:hypothetical protein|nr:MAG TPA: restriction endonuclease [Inoviridae sp.]